MVGVDSQLVNTKTNEMLDVRGFGSFTQEEIHTALSSRASALALVKRYTDRPGKDPILIEPYRQWLTDLLMDFSVRGGATSVDIALCSDDRFDETPSWYEVIGNDAYTQIGDVWAFDPEHPEVLYRKDVICPMCSHSKHEPTACKELVNGTHWCFCGVEIKP